MNQDTERFYILDIFRFLASIAIVLFHYKLFYANSVNLDPFITNQQPLYNVFFLAYEHGWVAVQFFFILSGFIFYSFYLDKISNNQIDFYNFFLLRFSRLYPLHLLTFILMIVIASTKIIVFTNMDIFHFFLNIFLIQAWGFEAGGSFNDPSWSISIEILMYSIFFFISLRKKTIFLTTTFLILISSVIIFKFKLLGYGGLCFYIGGMTSLLYNRFKDQIFNENKNKKKVLLLLFIQILLTIIIISKFAFSSIQIKIILFFYFFPLIILTSIFLQQYKPLFISKISKIGNISYSIYMIHYVLQYYIISAVAYLKIVVNFNSPLVLLSYLVVLILISYFSNKYFEKPIQKSLRVKFFHK